MRPVVPAGLENVDGPERPAAIARAEAKALVKAWAAQTPCQPTVHKPKENLSSRVGVKVFMLSLLSFAAGLVSSSESLASEGAARAVTPPTRVRNRGGAVGTTKSMPWSALARLVRWLVAVLG